MAIASIVWRNSDRPMNDFEGLSPRLLKVISEGIPDDADEQHGNGVVWNSSIMIARNVIAAAPETPDLAIKLAGNVAKYAPRTGYIAEAIGDLGSRGEPAVPILVEQLLKELNKFPSLYREVERLRQKGDNESQIVEAKLLNQTHFCIQIISALGKIGGVNKGYDLIRQLKIIATSPVTLSGKNNKPLNDLLEAIDKAYPKFSPAVISETKAVGLSDFWLFNGVWKLRDDPANRPESTLTAQITGDDFVLSDEPGGAGEIPSFVELFKKLGFGGDCIVVFDEAKTPKQLTLLEPNRDNQRNFTPRRIEGIYQLETSKLKIQLATPGQPRPKEFSAEASQAPTGEILVEFDRIMPEDVNRSNKPE